MHLLFNLLSEGCKVNAMFIAPLKIVTFFDSYFSYLTILTDNLLVKALCLCECVIIFQFSQTSNIHVLGAHTHTLDFHVPVCHSEVWRHFRYIERRRRLFDNGAPESSVRQMK